MLICKCRVQQYICLTLYKACIKMQLSKVMIPGNLSEYYKYYKKHFPLPFFSGKHGEKTGPRKYSMNTTNDLTVRSLMQLANVSLVKFGTTWRQML